MRTFTLVVLLFFGELGLSFGQSAPDTLALEKFKKDSIFPDSNRAARQLRPGSLVRQNLKTDTMVADSNRTTLPLRVTSYAPVLTELLSRNKFIGHLQNPVFFVSQKKQGHGKENLFYAISTILLLLGVFKVFYAAYFNNIFRFFFNASLRQNQLTDLLLQARLPSLIFNIFFTLSAGLYLWLLLPYYYPIYKEFNISGLFICVTVIGIICILRFCALKLMGWVTGQNQALNTYIFIIFLVNKIVGIALIPFILLLAFASPQFINTAITVSLLLLTLFFLIRFFRSYSLLQQQVNISLPRFLLYTTSLEIFPLLLIYKLLLVFLNDF